MVSRTSCARFWNKLLRSSLLPLLLDEVSPCAPLLLLVLLPAPASPLPLLLLALPSCSTPLPSCAGVRCAKRVKFGTTMCGTIGGLPPPTG